MKQVVKRLSLVLVLVSMLGLAPGTASASPPVGGCPGSFDLKHETKRTEIADLNGDDWVCVKDIPAFPPGSINVIDNNV